MDGDLVAGRDLVAETEFFGSWGERLGNADFVDGDFFVDRDDAAKRDFLGRCESKLPLDSALLDDWTLAGVLFFCFSFSATFGFVEHKSRAVGCAFESNGVENIEHKERGFAQIPRTRGRILGGSCIILQIRLRDVAW